MSAEVDFDEVVPDALAGQRIDRVVAMITGGSRSDAAARIDRGDVRLGGEVVIARSLRVEGGDAIAIAAAPMGDDRPAAQRGDVVVVHEDDDLVIVDKPPGLVVHPGAGNPDGTLVNLLLDRYPAMAGVGDVTRPGIVHRLDKGTSGLLVVALSQPAYEGLVAALKRHDVERVYLALVRGHVEADAGRIDAPIGRSGRDPTRMTVSAKGKEARTGYRVLERTTSPDLSLVECRLETGRTHQIRVHFASIGHPVIGDRRYGGDHGARAADRPWLHAAELAFRHPVSGEDVRATSPVPADLQAIRDSRA